MTDDKPKPCKILPFKPKSDIDRAFDNLNSAGDRGTKLMIDFPDIDAAIDRLLATDGTEHFNDAIRYFLETPMPETYATCDVANIALDQLFDIASKLHVLRELEVEATRSGYLKAADTLRKQRHELQDTKESLFRTLDGR